MGEMVLKTGGYQGKNKNVDGKEILNTYSTAV